MVRGARLPKYAPLSEYLIRETAARVILTFPAIEAILGAPLPPAARIATFWSNRDSERYGAQAWCRAGWRVAAVDLAAVVAAVTFEWAPLASSSWQPVGKPPDSAP